MTKNSTSNFIISELDDRFQQQRSGYDKVKLYEYLSELDKSDMLDK